MIKKTEKKDHRGGPGRGQGRRALDGRGVAGGRRPLARINVMLDEETMLRAAEIGGGNVSLGIRVAVARAKLPA